MFQLTCPSSQFLVYLQICEFICCSLLLISVFCVALCGLSVFGLLLSVTSVPPSFLTSAEDDVMPWFVGKQTKDETVDRLLWRGVLQGHHSSYTCHFGGAANAWGAHVGVTHSARGLL